MLISSSHVSMSCFRPASGTDHCRSDDGAKVPSLLKQPKAIWSNQLLTTPRDSSLFLTQYHEHSTSPDQTNQHDGQVSGFWQKCQVRCARPCAQQILANPTCSTGFTNNVAPAWSRGLQWARETAGQTEDKVDSSSELGI